MRGHVQFEGVGFHYGAGLTEVLRDISFEIRPGEVVALLGKPDESRRDEASYLVYRRGAGLIEFDWGGGSLENVLMNRQ